MPTKNISILGTGKIGLALTTLWSRAGHSICLGSRHPEKLQTNLPVSVKSIKEAVTENTIIVLAVPYSAIPDLMPTIAHDLEGKIVIDATNPFGISPEGHVISTLGSHITAGTYMASLLPKSIIVRAFTHVMDELLLSRGVKHPGLFAMAIAGDDHDAKTLVSELVTDTGFVPVDIGMLKESAPLDPGGILFPQFFTVADMKSTLDKNKTAGLLRRIVTGINDVGMASGIFLMIALIANALGVFASTKLYEAMSYDYLIHHLNSSIVSLFTPEQIEKIQHSIAYFDSTSSTLVAWLNLPHDLFSHAMSAGIEASMLLSGIVTLVGAGIAAALIGKNNTKKF